jgi:hypothetical protein
LPTPSRPSAWLKVPSWLKSPCCHHMPVLFRLDWMMARSALFT